MTKRNKYKDDPFIGTGRIGQFQATTAQIVKVFGYPTICNDDNIGPQLLLRKTMYEWRLRTSFGPITIYDWKEEDQDFPDDKLICWQVGGRCESYANRTEHPALEWLERQLGVAVEDKRYRPHRPHEKQAKAQQLEKQP